VTAGIVDRDTFTISVESIEGKLTADTKAIMPVHIFGHAAPMARITALAAERNVIVIEDAAQAAGGVCDGQPMGGHGDFSILSFGGDKIIRAGAGGALLTDNDVLAATIAADAQSLPRFSRPPAYALKSLSHRNLCHALVDLLRVDPDLDLSDIFMNAMPLYADLYLQRSPEAPEILDEIARGLETLDENNRLRVDRGRRYQELLSGSDVTVPQCWADSGVLWRFSFLVNDPAKTAAVTQALRDEQIHASNHYWSLADLMYGVKDHPNTAHICPRIVNLWVDGTATPEYVARSCDVIETSLRVRPDHRAGGAGVRSPQL